MRIASIDEALKLDGVDVCTLTAHERRALDDHGFVVLRGVLEGPRCSALVETFEQKVLTSDQWPMPREHDTRHALLDHEEVVWQSCLEPRVLACVHHLLRSRFFLTTVQGRDPNAGGGYQPLHCDWPRQGGSAPIVTVLAFLERFGAANGATRIVPGSHRVPDSPEKYAVFGECHPEQIVIAGEAGDILVFDGYLVHSATRNVGGSSRRTLQMNFSAIEMRASHVEPAI